jgi:hypothetical protein
MRTHTVKVIESSDEFRNFTIEITNHEGESVLVSIPKEIFSWKDKDDSQFGLNLVTRGHYE